MVYRLSIAKEIMRQIDHLPGNMRQRIRRAIAQLPTDPRPLASKQMAGNLSAYHRLRIEEYRIIYTIDDEIKRIEILRVARRSPQTYEGLN